jgi:hypothetical protein
VLEFYSGAAGLSGRFTEGFSLRRSQVGEQGEVLCRSSPFGEDASGYAHLFELLGPPEGCLLAWKRPDTIGAIYFSLC